MQDDQKTKAELLQELDSLHSRVSKLTQVEEKLKQYQFMVESAYDVIFFKDLKSRYVIANNKTLEAFGLSREQVIGKNDYEIMPNKDEAQKNIEDDNIVFKTGKLTKITKHMTSTDGKERWFQAIKVPQFDEEGKIIGLIGIARDITECKKAEGELRESEERYRTLYETIKDGMAGGPMDGRILECNQALADMLGYSKAELRNLTYQEITPERWHQMEAKIVEEQILKRGYSDEYEKEYIRKDGTVFPISARVWLRKDKDGKPVGMWGIVRDITERKRAEEALKESEHQKKAILDSTPDLAWLKNKQGVYIAANEPLCKAFGVKLEDLVGKTDFDISPEDLAKKYRADDEKVMKSGKRKRIVEQWGKKKGKRIWIETIKTPIYNDSGELIGTSGIARDITESKKAEQDLQAKTAILQNIISNIPYYVFWKDKNSIYLGCNDNFAKLAGVEKIDDIIGKTDYDLPWKKEESDFYRKIDKEVISKGKPILNIEEPVHPGQGMAATLLTSKVPLRNEDGEITGILGIFTDITERKKAEEALKESEEKFRNLAEESPNMIFINKKGRIVYVNKKCEEIMGYTKRDFYSPDFDFLSLISPEQTDLARSSFEIHMSGKDVSPHEYGLITKQGKRIETLVATKLIPYDGENAILGIITDMTEHKKAEEQIRRLSSAVEQSIDGIAVAIGDLEPRLVYVNEAFARMHGYTPKEMIGMPTAKLHNQEQMSEYKTRINQLITEGSTEGEIGHVRKDGTAFPTYMYITLLKNEEGKTTGSLAVTRDITESKQREKELNLYREKMARAEQLASLGTLSATLAHELTQPLTVVNLSIENALAKLETMPSAAAVIKNIEDSLTEVSNITSIVNRFRNYARRSTKRIVSEVDLKAVAERTVQLLSASARQGRVTLRLEGMDKLPHIYASEKDIEQLFFALVENAVQAADGKKDRRLIIDGDVKEERIELRFCDDCGGIAPENLDRIFEPFFTTRPAGEGTGLGLCIVQDVVARAGGKVRVESEHGKGSTFFVTLPINKGGQS